MKKRWTRHSLYAKALHSSYSNPPANYDSQTVQVAQLIHGQLIPEYDQDIESIFIPLPEIAREFSEIIG